MDTFVILISAILMAIGCLYSFLVYRFNYWKRKRVVSPKASFIGGHIRASILQKENMGIVFADIYLQTKQHPFIGVFVLYSPAILINDLDLARAITTKDFHIFHSHGLGYDPVNDPLSNGLFMMDGPEWKRMRTKLTPTFTTSKMKYMFDTILECSKIMEDYLDDEASAGNEVDFKEVISKYGTDVIGSCAFGIETNSFKYPDAEFRRMGKKFFENFQSLTFSLSLIAPSLVENFHLRLVPREVEDFFIKTVKETVEYRQGNNINRNDFLQLLIDMKEADDLSRTECSLTITEMAAQAFLFFTAGFETSSTTANFALFELAKNQDIQNKLYQEIDDNIKEHDGKITYESISKMTYLTQVIQETLRMYPPLPIMFRKASEDYVIPNSDVTIKKDMLVLIPILGIHKDSNLYEDPDRFMPERFNPGKRNEAHPLSYIPFGEGPRICIGSRFGMMQTRLALIAILSKYKVSPGRNSPGRMIFHPKGFLLSPKFAETYKITKRK